MSKSIELHIHNALGIKAHLIQHAGLYRVQPDAVESPEFAAWDAARPHTEVDNPIEAALIFADRLGRFELEHRSVSL